MYDLGQGVRQNYIAAVKWYNLAAEGAANAQAALGQMHQNGEGVPKDLIRAHMWFHIAATAGVKYADEAKFLSKDFLPLKLKKHKSYT